MITLENDTLTFRFDDLHADAKCDLNFMRTARIPDDGKNYPLPAGIGTFPLRHVDDCSSRIGDDLRRRGGIVLPMHASEAMWINCGRGSKRRYPFALKIAAGKINAITGKPWSAALTSDPQDYLVIPEQPWLDGFCIEKGIIRQFVAERLGAGYSFEEQLTGKVEFGGLQIIAYPMKREFYDAMEKRWRLEHEEAQRNRSGGVFMFQKTGPNSFGTLGLAGGGRMRQEIYADPHGIDAWDQSVHSRCFVTLLDAADWPGATGEAVPTAPLSITDYQRMGLPWFDYYAPAAPAVGGGQILSKLKSWATVKAAKGEVPKDNTISQSLDPIPIGPARRIATVVREADF